MASAITVTSNPDPAQLQSLGVTSWPTWGCGVSTFPWTYDEQETCLLLEGGQLGTAVTFILWSLLWGGGGVWLYRRWTRPVTPER